MGGTTAQAGKRFRCEQHSTIRLYYATDLAGWKDKLRSCGTSHNRMHIQCCRYGSNDDHGGILHLLRRRGDITTCTKTIYWIGSARRVQSRRCYFQQNDAGERVFVIEEGAVQFLIGEQVAGIIAGAGSVFGELSVVYGLPRQMTVQVTTPCVIAWTIHDLAFRRIQAAVAN